MNTSRVDAVWGIVSRPYLIFKSNLYSVRYFGLFHQNKPVSVPNLPVNNQIVRIFEFIDTIPHTGLIRAILIKPKAPYESLEIPFLLYEIGSPIILY
jgi:hypothetical protein